MSARLEAFLARLYADPALVERFLADRASAVAAADIEPEHRDSILRIDAVGLRLMAQSCARKRAGTRVAQTS